MFNKIFHVHTYRCLHASDEREEEYVKKAIELGTEEIVFTDHAPFPDNPFRFRMAMEELSEYVSVLNDLKKKYEYKINIQIGLEIEYVPTYVEYYRSLKDTWKLDFLLLGQHFSLLADGRYTFELKDKSDEAKMLADGMLEGMRTGLFQAVAHPDQIFRRMKKWDDGAEALSREIKECAPKMGIPLEQNIGNMQGRKKAHVFWPEFWKMTPENLKIIYGVDAHFVEEMEKNYCKQQELQGRR